MDKRERAVIRLALNCLIRETHRIIVVEDRILSDEARDALRLTLDDADTALNNINNAMHAEWLAKEAE